MLSFKTSFLTLFVSFSLLATSGNGFKYGESFINQVTSYPNIVTAKARCMPGKSGTGGVLICDPHEVLPPTQLNMLNDVLLKMQESINRDHGKCDRRYPRPTIAIALVDSMRLGITDERTDETVINYAAMFSYYLFESWRLPSTCEAESDKIIIFYSKSDGVLYLYAGENLREKLPRDVIRRTAVESKAAFGSGVYEGMGYLLQRLEEILTSNRSGMFGARR